MGLIREALHRFNGCAKIWFAPGTARCGYCCQHFLCGRREHFETFNFLTKYGEKNQQQFSGFVISQSTNVQDGRGLEFCRWSMLEIWTAYPQLGWSTPNLQVWAKKTKLIYARIRTLVSKKPMGFHDSLSVLSRYVESLFASTGELYPWGNFPGNVQNQSINQA